MIAHWKKLIVRTVIAFQQVIAVTFFSVNLMQASSLSTDGSLVATTKTPKVIARQSVLPLISRTSVVCCKSTAMLASSG